MSNGFLGQDWSFANLKNTLGGVLSDPESLTTNPLFRAGMGILSENRKPFGGDPFGGALAGISGAKKQREADEDREAIAKAREEILAILRQRYGTGGMTQVDPRTGALSSPLPQGMAPPRSIMDLYRSGGGAMPNVGGGILGP